MEVALDEVRHARRGDAAVFRKLAVVAVGSVHGGHGISTLRLKREEGASFIQLGAADLCHVSRSTVDQQATSQRDMSACQSTLR